MHLSVIGQMCHANGVTDWLWCRLFRMVAEDEAYIISSTTIDSVRSVVQERLDVVRQLCGSNDGGKALDLFAVSGD